MEGKSCRRRQIFQCFSCCIGSRNFSFLYSLGPDCIVKPFILGAVSAGKNPFRRGFQPVIHHRPMCHGIYSGARTLGKLVFRNQSAGEQKRVTGDKFLRSRYGFQVFIHSYQRNCLHPVLSVNLRHRMAKAKRNPKIVQALNNISLQSAGIGHDLRHQLYLRSLQAHSSCHNQADIPGTKNHHLPARHAALYVYKALGRPGTVDS